MTSIQIRDVSLYVKVIGHGYPLVLMHGGPSLDHSTLLPLEPLADQFTLVFYDHRCNGRSEGSAMTSMTWENLTADADALRQALGYDQWAVLGHSFGGNVALEYALRYPNNLSHLVLMDTGGDQWWVRHNAPEVLAKRGYRPAVVQSARRFYSGNLAPDEVFPIVQKFFSAYNYRNNPLEMVTAVISGHFPKMQPEALVFGYSQLLNGWTVMDRLSEIQVPTLVLAGRQDFLFPPEHQAILADRIPNARLEIIERAGHSPHAEQQAEVTRIIRSFITNLRAGYGSRSKP